MALEEFILDPLGSAVSVSFAGGGDLRISDAGWGQEPGAGDWAWAVPIYMDSIASTQAIIAKYLGSGVTNNRSYVLTFNQPAGAFQLTVSSLGTGASNVALTDTSLGASVTTGVWYDVVFGRRGSTIFISVTPVSAGARNASVTAAYAGNTFNGAAQLTFGAIIADNGSRLSPMIGRIGQAYYWQGTIPTEANFDSKFNGGAGLSRRAYLASGLPTPNAAFELEEATGNRVDWVGGKNLSVSGTVTYAAGHPFDVDFTTTAVAVAYAQANKISGDEWHFNCYSGADITGGSGVTISAVPVSSSGPLKVQAASGHFHEGDFAAGAWCSGIYIVQSYVECLKLRSAANGFFYIYSIAGATSGAKVKQCIAESGAIYVAAYADASPQDFEIINNLIKTSLGGAGIQLTVNGDGVASSLTGLIAHNTFIGNFSDSGILLQAAGGSHDESIDLELLNNIIVDFTTCIDRSGTFDTETIDSQANVTSDATGEIIDVEPGEIFVDPDNGDYDTLVSGPSYRAGVAAGISIDILDRERNAITPDAGAFENPELPIGGNSGAFMLLGVG